MIGNRGNNNGGEMVEAEPSSTGLKGQGLKKGPWSASEDAILIEYVKKHGEGNWNSVQKNSGLMRCGKSCRLRWANHLRPNLKKGSFTPEEERIIIELHAKLGNKWARMASQLPGRTDNEIKNYWNTRMKRRQRAGLPIYPKELQKEAAAFRFKQQQQQQQEQQKFPSSSSAPSLSPLLSSSQKAPYNPSLSLYDPTHLSATIDPQNHANSSFYSNPNQQVMFLSDSSTNNDSLAFPLPSVSPYVHSPSSAPQFNQNLTAQGVPTTPPSLQYDAVDFGTNISFTSLIMGSQVDPIDLVTGLKSEPPSNQTPPHAKNPVYSNTIDSVCDKDMTAPVAQGDINSGLLDALLQEANTLSCKGKSSHRNPSVASNKGKHILADKSREEEEEEVDAAEAAKRVRLSLKNGSETSCENQYDDLSSFQSSIGMKSTDQEPMEETNSMDDGLLSLLNNFPSSMPLPEWYRQSREESNGSSSAITGDVKGLHPRQQDQDTSRTQGVATTDASPNLEWALGPRYWNNMPGIC